MAPPPPAAAAGAAEQSDRGFAAMVWLPVGALVAVLSVGILQVGDMITLFWLGTLINMMLSVTKMTLAQVATHPKALLADALHGLGDTVAEVVTALAYAEAARPPDKEHPWGHGKIETVGAVLVATILLYIAATMGWESAAAVWPILARRWQVLRGGDAPEAPTGKEAGCGAARGEQGHGYAAGEGRLVRHAGIAVTLTSVLLKEALFKSTMVVGEHEQSNLIVANAWHHRSDSLAAGVSLVSQLGASFGQHYLDPLGGGVVACMLAHSASGSLYESVNDLLDYNAAAEAESRSRCGRESLSRSIAGVQGVRNHTIRTRRMGPYCLVDTTIVVDARISASAASVIAEAVHDRVVGDFRPFVTDVQVHVDPEGSPQSHRLETHAELAAGASGHLVGPEELEESVREALLSLGDARPDLPRIAEVTEFQTYYYMEQVIGAAQAADTGEGAAYVDVKVDVRLDSEEVPIRAAAAVARAARSRVLAALPGIVRELDMDLELVEAETSSLLPPMPDAASDGEATVCRSHSAITGEVSHGSWQADPCPPPSRAALAQRLLASEERGKLERVTLIWERGPESREARVPTIRHDRRATWTPVRAAAPEAPPGMASRQRTTWHGVPQGAGAGTTGSSGLPGFVGSPSAQHMRP